MELEKKIMTLISRSSKEGKNRREGHGWLCGGRLKVTLSDGKKLKGRPQTGGWK